MTNFHNLASTLIVELGRALRDVDDVDSLRHRLLDSSRIFVAGKGRSGLVMRAFAMRLMHLGLQVYVVDDVTTPAITVSDLLLIGTGSGQTASLVQYAQKAKSLGADVAVITTNSDSPIIQHADCVVKINNTTSTTLPMRSLFEQALSLILDVIIVQLMEDTSTTADEMFSRHENLE